MLKEVAWRMKDGEQRTCAQLYLLNFSAVEDGDSGAGVGYSAVSAGSLV